MWAEVVVVQLFILALDYCAINKKYIFIHCDNNIVIEGQAIRWSQNIFVNNIFKDIYLYLNNYSYNIKITYVPSYFNSADRPS